MKPHRVQLSRKAGWKKPENTVVVARPTMWGNPFVPGRDGVPDRETAVAKFRAITATPGWSIGQMTAETVRRDLRGHNLACWCSLDGPCHADCCSKSLTPISFLQIPADVQKLAIKIKPISFLRQRA